MEEGATVSTAIQIAVQSLSGEVVANVALSEFTVDKLKEAVKLQLKTPVHLVCDIDLLQGDRQLVDGEAFCPDALPITVLTTRPEPRNLVVDAGEYEFKAGFAEDDAPTFLFPTVVVDDVDGDLLVGSDAIKKQDVLELKCPIYNRMVTHWNHMEAIWRHAFFNELCVSPEEHHIILTDVPVGPKANRERLTSLTFETFKVAAMYLMFAPVLAMYSSGRTTGLAVDSGGNVTHVVPIYEGYSLPHAIRQLPVGGNHLTSLLGDLLAKRGLSFTSKSDLEHLRSYKEKRCYIALDFDAEMAQDQEPEGKDLQQYEFGDGRCISSGSERFCCPEALFQPRRFNMVSLKEMFGARHLPPQNKEMSGLHIAVYESIQLCDCDIKNDLYGNIVLAGGNTMFQGMQERLKKELVALAPTAVKVNVIASPERRYAAWIGGSILASLSTFKGMWITKDEFGEAGPAIVHRKCY